MFAELKECFMESFDVNKDGKIDIREVCMILMKEKKNPRKRMKIKQKMNE